MYRTIIFFGDLFVTFRHYYFAKYMLLTCLIWLIFFVKTFLGGFLVQNILKKRYGQ